MDRRLEQFQSDRQNKLKLKVTFRRGPNIFGDPAKALRLNFRHLAPIFRVGSVVPGGPRNAIWNSYPSRRRQQASSGSSAIRLFRRSREHLLRLDPHSRRDRFNAAIDDDFVIGYAARCFADGTTVIGYVEGEHVLGAAELHEKAGEAEPTGEIAFSVERHLQRRGIGSALFLRLIGHARGLGYTRLRVTTHPQNAADAGVSPQVRRASELPGWRHGRRDLSAAATTAANGIRRFRGVIEPAETKKARFRGPLVVAGSEEVQAACWPKP